MAKLLRNGFQPVILFAVAATLGACSGPSAPPAAESPGPGAGMTVFTGARVIVGDGTVIEASTFTIEADRRFGLVGHTATVELPAGAASPMNWVERSGSSSVQSSAWDYIFPAGRLPCLQAS